MEFQKSLTLFTYFFKFQIICENNFFSRCLHLVKMHITHKKPLLLVGPSGTGKTAYIKNHFIHELPAEEYWTQNVTMTMNITAKETQVYYFFTPTIDIEGLLA